MEYIQQHTPTGCNLWLFLHRGYFDICLLQGLGLFYWVQKFECRYVFRCRGFVKKIYGYCKPLYFRVFFISRFSDWKLTRGNLKSRCIGLSYVNAIHAHISRESWIRDGWNSRILAKIKFSRIIVNLQYANLSGYFWYAIFHRYCFGVSVYKFSFSGTSFSTLHFRVFSCFCFRISSIQTTSSWAM